MIEGANQATQAGQRDIRYPPPPLSPTRVLGDIGCTQTAMPPAMPALESVVSELCVQLSHYEEMLGGLEAFAERLMIPRPIDENRASGAVTKDPGPSLEARLNVMIERARYDNSRFSVLLSQLCKVI